MKSRIALAAFIALAATASAQEAVWQYGTEGAGEALTAFATAPGATEAGENVELRFSSSDLAGRQLRIHNLPEALDCEAGCRLALTIDGASAQTVRATLPPQPQNALSLRGARDIWRSLAGADALEIVYPLEGGASGTARFTVTGLDLSMLPGWD